MKRLQCILKFYRVVLFLSDLTVSGPRIYTHFKVLLKESESSWVLELEIFLPSCVLPRRILGVWTMQAFAPPVVHFPAELFVLYRASFQKWNNLMSDAYCVPLRAHDIIILLGQLYLLRMCYTDLLSTFKNILTPSVWKLGQVMEHLHIMPYLGFTGHPKVVNFF